MRTTLAVTLAALNLACAASAAVTSAQSPSPQAWYWAKERAESVARVPDQPEGCLRAIYHSNWIGNCVSANYTYGGASCVGVGPRTISSTEDVYLYKTFRCMFATNSWNPGALKDAHQQAAAHSGGIGGSRVWIEGAALKGKGTLRVQVTGRFTALVTWLGRSWKMTIQPTG